MPTIRQSSVKGSIRQAGFSGFRKSFPPSLTSFLNVASLLSYSEPPIAQLQWALDADDLAIPLYRVLRTKRTAEGDFEISALQFEPSKFAFIDTGARLEERPISVIPITVVPVPASVTLTSSSVVSQGIAVATMAINWPVVPGAVGYDVEWRKDSGNRVKVQRTGMTSVDVVGIYTGAYVARVRAVILPNAGPVAGVFVPVLLSLIHI